MTPKAPKHVKVEPSKRSTVLIEVAEGSTYANVMGKLRKEADPDASHTSVVRARLT